MALPQVLKELAESNTTNVSELYLDLHVATHSLEEVINFFSEKNYTIEKMTLRFINNDYPDESDKVSESAFVFELAQILPKINGLKHFTLHSDVKTYALKKILDNLPSIKKLEFRAENKSLHNKEFYEVFLVDYLTKNKLLTHLFIQAHWLMHVSHYPKLKQAMMKHPCLFSFCQGIGDTHKDLSLCRTIF